VSDLIELFTEVTQPGQLRPVVWSCDEALCGSLKLSLTALAPVALGDSLAAQLFGQRATFVVNGTPSFVRRGVVCAVGIGNTLDPDFVELVITMVPRLDLMKLRKTSRIFQSISTVDVLAALAAEWQLPCEMRLSKAYGRRRYISQYRETDFEFLGRITARDGIGYFLEHAELGPGEREKPGDEKLVFYDHEQAYAAIPTGIDPAQADRLVAFRERFDAHEHHVAGFRLDRSIAPELVRLGDFDFNKPRLSLRAQAAVTPEKRSPINTSLGGEQLSVYLHADRAELDMEGGKSEISDDLAAVRLQQAQRDAVVGRGRTRCLRLSPGGTFLLEAEGQAESLGKRYVVSRLQHRGRVPEAKLGDDAGPVYENSFECVPASVVYRPALPTLDVRQVTETATVIGPEGSDLHTDELGRVEVKFHWDAGGEGGTSCWLRTSTPWAGAGWGSQFLPRVGMEVLVGFLSGDVDQPVVLGAVYNGTHPTPFALPAEAAKAGFRTQSSPGGDGGSELTFDDTKGKERFVLRAERDLSQAARNHFDLTVGGNERVAVTGQTERTVGGDSARKVLGGSTESIAKDAVLTVGGSTTTAITGNRDLRVNGNLTTRVEGREHSEHFQELTRLAHAGVTERVSGHKITVVGESDAQRSATLHVEGSIGQSASGLQELTSEKEIVLRVGSTSLRLTPTAFEVVADEVRFVSKRTVVQSEQKIELFSRKSIAAVAETLDLLADKRAVLSGEQGKLKLAKDARLDGSVVKLNCDPAPPDPLEPPEYEPPKPTIIELCDEDGAPLVNRPFLLTFADGSERSGILDEAGRAEVFIDESCDISFPNVDGARRA
jgi:type VI secretion system secreted protein VgrG